MACVWGPGSSGHHMVAHRFWEDVTVSIPSLRREQKLLVNYLIQGLVLPKAWSKVLSQGGFEPPPSRNWEEPQRDDLTTNRQGR